MAAASPSAAARAEGPADRAWPRVSTAWVGVAVKDLSQGWTAAYDGDRLYPQQSVSKLWPALAVFDAVDRGELALSDPITVPRDTDMSVFNQPIQSCLDADGLYRTTIDGMLDWAISRKRQRRRRHPHPRKVGGPAPRPGGGGRAPASGHPLPAPRSAPGGRHRRGRLKPEYSFGEAFWEAR